MLPQVLFAAQTPARSNQSDGDVGSTVEFVVPTARRVAVTDDTLRVDLSDGRTISVPPAWFPNSSTLLKRNATTGV